MTLANQMTLARILLIPVFVFLSVSYSASISSGRTQECWRLAAVAVFLLACVTDILDGYAARRLGERSQLGKILDPIADKGLLLAAIITLSFSQWPIALPLWFLLLVITRDVVILAGCGLLFYLEKRLDVRPSVVGKMATAFQMLAVGWIMLQLPFFGYPLWIAGICTFASGVDYVSRGVLHLRKHG